MSMADKIRSAMRSFLKIEPADRQTFSINEELDFFGEAFAHRLWYRGSGSALNQFYSQLGSDTCPFWGSVPTKGLEIRKIHTGIPKLAVNMLSNIVIRDLNDIKFTDESRSEIWDRICKENKFNELLIGVVNDTLVVGDGAVKISLDPDISEYPILEWVGGDKTELEYERGRLKEIVFRAEYRHGERKYTLYEHYGFGYIRYVLFCGDRKVSLTDIPQTSELSDLVFDKSFMMAVPFKILQSERWLGRGQSVFEGKTDNFDALDETWSQWIHALRASRPVKYIPEILIPRNEDNGKLQKPNWFDNQFISVGSNMTEGARNEIEVKQPSFPSTSYLETYMTALDLALQGIISPSTLGIDTKKMDNAEAQREKEKATLYMRGIIIEGLSTFLKLLVDTVFKAYDTARKIPPEDVDADIGFGEYASPSFEAVVQTLSDPNTPMSIEARVDEMWGDSKDEAWKLKEVARIKEQQGIVTMDEPAVGGEFNV